MALTHLCVEVSGVIPAPCDEVWAVVRRFGDGRWIAPTLSGPPDPSQLQVQLLPGSLEGQIGALRAVSLGGSSYVEQLEGLDEDARVIKWKIVSHPLATNPFPAAFLNLKVSVRVQEVTREAAAFMVWTADFDTDLEGAEAMRAEIRMHMDRGFDGLTALLAAAAPGPALAGVSLNSRGNSLASSAGAPAAAEADLLPSLQPQPQASLQAAGAAGLPAVAPLLERVGLADAPSSSFTFPMRTEARHLPAGPSPYALLNEPLGVALHSRRLAEAEARARAEEERRASVDSAGTSRSSAATPRHAAAAAAAPPLHGNVDAALSAYLQLQREQQALDLAHAVQQPTDPARAFIQAGGLQSSGFHFPLSSHPLPSDPALLFGPAQQAGRAGGSLRAADGLGPPPPLQQQQHLAAAAADPLHLFRRSAEAHAGGSLGSLESVPRSVGPSPLHSPRVSLGSRDGAGARGSLERAG